MILNILIMVWIAFNIVLILDDVVISYQHDRHKNKLPRSRHQLKSFDYEKWRSSKPKRAFKLNHMSFLTCVVAAPSFLVFGSIALGLALILSLIAATQAFFETFKEGFK